jgi:hypothetical protein
VNTEFEVHMLNTDGVRKANLIAEIFDSALNDLNKVCPPSRESAIVRTKLEEACFFAKKAMASDPANHKL